MSTLQEIISAGHYFSVNPAMLHSINGCKIIAKIPPEILLTETDGPFVKIEDKIVTSKNITLVQKHLCSVWNCTYESVERQIKENFNPLLLPIKQFRNDNCSHGE